MFRFYSRIRRLPEISEGDCPDSSVRDFRGRSCTNVENFRHSSPRDHGSFDRSFERGNFTFLLSKKKRKNHNDSFSNDFYFRSIYPQVDGLELNMTAGTKERLAHFVKGLKDEFLRKSYDKRIFLVLPTKSEDLAKQYDLKELSK